MNETRIKKVTEKKHKCLQCGVTFPRPYRLKQHEKVHLNIKEFVCGETNCNKSYTNKSHLDRHIQSVHIDKIFNVIYSCPDCQKVYANRQNLKRHLKIHHTRKTWFNCDVCNASFPKKHQLSGHMYQHTFVKSFSCELCSAEFITIPDKRKHMKNHKTYCCKQCDMAFVQWSKYRKHKNTVHLAFICDDCGKKFTKRAHMIRHTALECKNAIIARTITDDFFSFCELCSAEFITISDKRKHMKHHKTYCCEQCDMAFVQWSKYRKHKNTVHLAFICDDCGRKFTKRAHMIRHTKVHNSDHTPKCYPCTYENCQRVYTRNGNLKQHIRMKHLKLKHECEICGSKLCTKAKLLDHLRTHNREPKKYSEPTKNSRKIRCDKGSLKTSTALRIAGLTLDLEDGNIEGTLKSDDGHVEPDDKNIKVTLKTDNEHVEPDNENIKGTLKRDHQDHVGPETECMGISDIAPKNNSSMSSTEQNTIVGLKGVLKQINSAHIAEYTPLKAKYSNVIPTKQNLVELDSNSVK